MSPVLRSHRKAFPLRYSVGPTGLSVACATAKASSCLAKRRRTTMALVAFSPCFADRGIHGVPLESDGELKVSRALALK